MGVHAALLNPFDQRQLLEGIDQALVATLRPRGDRGESMGAFCVSLPRL